VRGYVPTESFQPAEWAGSEVQRAGEGGSAAESPVTADFCWEFPTVVRRHGTARKDLQRDPRVVSFRTNSKATV